MKKLIGIIIILQIIGSSLTLADWDPEDGHKMHFPQLPDPNGWDIYAISPTICADDWECSETGFIQDIHFWGSWLGDEIGDIIKFKIWIYEDNPIPDSDYSEPGEELWYREIDNTSFEIRGPYLGNQGWYWPNLNEWNLNDHIYY